MSELKDLSYSHFNDNIKGEIEKQNKFEKLREEEKQLNMQIKKVTEDMRKAQDEHAAENDERDQEIKDLKKRLNETEVEAALHIQHLENCIKGEQDCQNRLYLKEETALEEEIKQLKSQIETENKVNDTIRKHLTLKTSELKKEADDRDALCTKMTEELEKEKEKVKQDRLEAHQEYNELMAEMGRDDDARKRRAHDEELKRQEEENKMKEKMSMEDAARFIQRKWTWYQTVGRFMKGKKKKGKGGKKKKKK